MENTREKLIEATYEEVYSHGYQGASLSNILNTANVHKGSMYHFFKNKKELVLCAISEKMNERYEKLFQIIIKENSPCLQPLYALLRDTTRRDFKRGCPLGNLVQEMSNLDNDFDKTLKKIYQSFCDVLENIYNHAVKMKELPSTCNTRRLALFSVSCLEGALLSVKASSNDQDFCDVVEELITHIENQKTKTI